MKRKLIHWAPRILGILAILFWMLFSLDCFGENDSLREKLLCLLMHNIPVYICIAALMVSWKYQLVGGILFIVVFIAAGIFFHSFASNPASMIVIGPILLTGVLFLMDYRVNKKKAIT